jgi:hypothetical protein
MTVVPSLTSRHEKVQVCVRQMTLDDIPAVLDLQRETALDVDPGQFFEFTNRVVLEFPAFARSVGSFGIGLRADRNIFAGRH